MKASFVFEMVKINIEPVINPLPFLLTIWALFWIHEFVQKENDD